MAANIPVTLSSWSTTAGSNQPDSTDLASTLREDLQAIQAAVRYLRTAGTIASASTTDMATKSEEILSVSGTTTITALGTVSAGMVKVLVFEGALTFTHGTSLILPTAANITTAADDVAVMLSLGSGNWRCLSYTKKSGQPVNTAVSVATVATTGDITSNARVYFGAANNSNSNLFSDASNADITFDSGDLIRFTLATNTWQFFVGSSAYVAVNASGVLPSVDGSLGIGGSSNKWLTGYITTLNYDNLVDFSDKRFKTHVENLYGAWSGPLIDRLQPVRYTWTESGKMDIGFYAQDVAEVLPEATMPPRPDDDTWGMQPDKLIPLLVAEIQSLRARVAMLENK